MRYLDRVPRWMKSAARVALVIAIAFAGLTFGSGQAKAACADGGRVYNGTGLTLKIWANGNGGSSTLKMVPAWTWSTVADCDVDSFSYDFQFGVAYSYSCSSGQWWAANPMGCYGSPYGRTIGYSVYTCQEVRSGGILYGIKCNRIQ